MQYNPQELTEILNIYKVESEEIIQGLNDGFMELEKNPSDKTPLKRLFQLAHSLKGSSRMLGITSVQSISHELEDILSYWKQDDVLINIDFFQIIYQACDMLGGLVEKAVEQKSDCLDAQVKDFIDKLSNFIKENNILLEDKKENSPNYIIEKSVDIKALILELLFVLEKDNLQDNYEESILVISDNVKQLGEIFSNTNYKEVKDIIAEILTLVNVSKDNNNNIESLKEKINSLRNIILNIYNESNLNASHLKHNINSIQDNNKEQKIEINKEKNALSLKFDYLLTNLQKIKSDKDFTKEVIDATKKVVSYANDKVIITILNKTTDFLNLICEKNIILDKNAYMVILQIMYLAKRIILSEEKKENIPNLNLLLQRLNVVEDMCNVKKEDPIKNLEIKEKNNIVSSGQYTNFQENIKAIDIQEIKTLRVDMIKLDNLIAQTGELLINGIKTREHVFQVAKINSKLTQWNSISKKILNYIKYLEKKGFFNIETEDGAGMFYKRAQSFFNKNAQIINELNNDFVNLYNIISEDDNKLHQTVMEIENIAKDIRVLPLATLFHSFPRMMRDIAKENNKEIDFVISGSDTTVDKKIIEEIKMPLIHILRNSVSHGIEKPEDRVKNNKSAVGTIKLSARQAENNVYITIEDDGYGVDLQKVKQIARTKNLLTDEEILDLNDEQLMKLIFLPGFSTKESVSEISGRGIGLDVVKTKITNLNGDINIDSVLNKGCKVTIKLPLSMSTMNTFIVLLNNQKYALPVSSIKLVERISKSDISYVNGQETIIFDNHSIPIYFLSDIFEYKKDYSQESQYTIIILENQEQQAAFVVDKLLGDYEVFQKKLVPPIIKIRNISGFTTLSTGEICLIINPYELLNNTLLSASIPLITQN